MTDARGLLRPWFPRVLSLAGALMAALGQWMVDASKVAAGVTLLLVGAVAFACSAPSVAQASDSSPIGGALSGPRSWWLVLGAFGLGTLGIPAFAANRVTLWAGLAWLAGLGLLAWAAWPVADLRRPERWIQPDGVRLSWSAVALLWIMLVGAIFRFYDLRNLPAEMGCDLPHIHGNIAQILRGEYAVFFPSWPGREGLFFYLAALPASLVGLSHSSIKAASATVGLVTLPAVYLLGCEIHSREAGLYGAAMLAVSHWHVILTRMGYRLSVMPLLVALALWAWLRARRTGGRLHYAFCGFLLGLGLHSYNAFMVAPFWLALLVLGEWGAGRGSSLRQHAQGLALLLAVMVYAALPLAAYAAANPQNYFFRVATRLTDQEVPLQGHPLWLLWQNTWRTIGMFNVRGDAIATSNVPGLRQLGYLPAALLPLGLGWALRRWRRDASLALLVTLPVMLAPTALSLAFPREVPNAGRAVGAVAPALLLAAVALVELRCAASQLALRLGADRWLVSAVSLALVLALLGGEMISGWRTCFVDYRVNLPAGNYPISRHMAEVIDAFAHEGNVYTVVWPHHYDGNAVRAQLTRGALPPERELPALVQGQPPLDDEPGKRMVILAPGDTASLDMLQAAFPRGIALTHVDYQGRATFVAFYGEK